MTPMSNGMENSFHNSCFFFVGLSVLLVVASVLVSVFLPTEKKHELNLAEAPLVEETKEDTIEIPSFVAYLDENAFLKRAGEDKGLMLYRELETRAAVEWFYVHVAGNQDVAMAILEAAEKNDIPLSLAFALAHTESHYNVNAVNRNTNNSIDRGLFQLNSASFPGLSEAEFFDPQISAKYGMAHLRFCLNTAGNVVPALAMYNAGTTKVRSNKTPQSTLNYVGKIMVYQETLDKLFEEEVVSYFDLGVMSGSSVAMAKPSRWQY